MTGNVTTERRRKQTATAREFAQGGNNTRESGMQRRKINIMKEGGIECAIMTVRLESKTGMVSSYDYYLPIN